MLNAESIAVDRLDSVAPVVICLQFRIRLAVGPDRCVPPLFIGPVHYRMFGAAEGGLFGSRRPCGEVRMVRRLGFREEKMKWRRISDAKAW